MIPKIKHVSQNNVFNRMLPITKSVELCLESEPKISDFNIIKELGTGSYSKVFLAQHKKTKAKYALKTIDKKLQINPEEKKQFLREVEIMYKVHHPNVVKIFGHFEDNSYCYLVTEYVEGGDLFSYIPNDGEPKLNTQQIASIIKDVISAIYYIHNMTPPIMHRDIKPENILINSDMQAKLTDFGWSNYIQPGEKRNSICGTPIYLAPEMITRAGHDQKVDIWSIGVLLFELMTGDQAWAGDDIETVKYNICNRRISWRDDMDTLGADLISKILQINPEERISLKDILNHPFFTQYFPDSISCLKKPDNAKYKTFVISKDNPLTFNPYYSYENIEQQQYGTNAYSSQAYNQNNYNYNYNYDDLFDKNTQNEYNQFKKQEQEFPSYQNYLKKESNKIEEEKISWNLEEQNKNEKNGLEKEKESSKNENYSDNWETTFDNLNEFNSYQINYDSFGDQVFLSDNNNNARQKVKKSFAFSSKEVIPSNNFQDHLNGLGSDNHYGKKNFAQSSKNVIPGNNIQIGNNYDFTDHNNINSVNIKEKKRKEIETQLYKAFYGNNYNDNYNNKFGRAMTFEQSKPNEFQGFLF